jgi:cell division protein FtsW (lipid II flippase)
MAAGAVLAAPRLDRGVRWSVAVAAIAVGVAGAAIGWPATVAGETTAHTDQVARAVRERGGLGAVAFLALAFGALLAGLSRVARARRPLASAAAGALVAAFSVQIALHAGVALLGVRLEQATLPFTSYGGSTIVGAFACLGIVHGLTRRAPIKSHAGC